VSGRLVNEAPLMQSAVPVALVATMLMAQTLVGVLAEFGTGSGGPKKHPTLEQFRMLPVSVEVRLPRVSAVPPHEVTLVIVLPVSGTAYGSGTVFPPPPM